MDWWWCFIEMVLSGVFVGIISLDGKDLIILLNSFVVILFEIKVELLMGELFYDVVLEMID